MAKIHPNNPSINSSSSCYSNSSEGKETFTIWMKSLVFHGNGCTIFNSKGEVVYRVDNYQQNCSSKVFLMDSRGEVLFSVKRKIFGCWEGYEKKSKVEMMKRPLTMFHVKRNYTTFLMSKDVICRVALKRNNENAGINSKYKIIGSKGKSAFKIIDHFSGQLLAEAVQKQSPRGVCLGEDVLTLTVEPKAAADQSLIMALVTVYQCMA